MGSSNQDVDHWQALVNKVTTCGFHKVQGFSWPPERLDIQQLAPEVIKLKAKLIFLITVLLQLQYHIQAVIERMMDTWNVHVWT